MNVNHLVSLDEFGVVTKPSQLTIKSTLSLELPARLQIFKGILNQSGTVLA